MASGQSLSVEDIHTKILEDGFYFGKDPILGLRIEQMDKDDTAFASPDGLLFCKINVLDNVVIRPILNAFFKWFGLGLYRSFGPRPGAYIFRQSDPESEIDALLVQLLSKGSEVRCWRKSHRYPLPSTWGENNLWRVPGAAFRKFGLEYVDETFEQGGFMIRNSRTAVEITAGSTITFGFGTKDVLSNWWNPMKIKKTTKTEGIEEIVAAMQSENFGMNVAYD